MMDIGEWVDKLLKKIFNLFINIFDIIKLIISNLFMRVYY